MGTMAKKLGNDVLLHPSQPHKRSAFRVDDRGFVSRILGASGLQQILVVEAEQKRACGIGRGQLVAVTQAQKALVGGENGQVIKAFAAGSEQQDQILHHLCLGESRVALAQLELLLDCLAHVQGHHGFQQQGKSRATGDLVGCIGCIEVEG